MMPHSTEHPLPHIPEAERAPLAVEWPSASEADRRLLDFVGSLIVDTARTNPRIRDLDVALWIARVAVGVKSK